MNKKGFTLLLSAVLIIATMAVMVSASGWQQFGTDEANAGIAVDSAPVAAPDGMTIYNVQPALQGVADFDEGTELENDGGNLLVLSDRTLYDFSTGAGESPKKAWAFKYQVGNSPGAGDPNEEFNATEYANIRFDDDVYASNQTTTDGNYAAHRFNFSIDDNEESWITKINVTWKGKGYRGTVGGGDDGATLYIWNGTGYEELANNTDGNKATLTGERTSGISDYINAGNVTILLKQKYSQSARDGASHIETDYVKLVVTP